MLDQAGDSAATATAATMCTTTAGTLGAIKLGIAEANPLVQSINQVYCGTNLKYVYDQRTHVTWSSPWVIHVANTPSAAAIHDLVYRNTCKKRRVSIVLLLSMRPPSDNFYYCGMSFDIDHSKNSPRKEPKPEVRIMSSTSENRRSYECSNGNSTK